MGNAVQNTARILYLRLHLTAQGQICVGLRKDVCEAHFSVPAGHMDAQFKVHFPRYTTVLGIIIDRTKNKTEFYYTTYTCYMKTK